MASQDGSGSDNVAAAVARLPDAVRRTARRADAGGWLNDLPLIVAELQQRWSITVGEVFSDATEAFVCAAQRSDGSAAVLKLLVPHGPDVDREITMLELVAGDGCVGLLEADRGHHALLVERLGPAMVDCDIPLGRRLPILTALAARIWRPAPESGFPTAIDRAERMIERITGLWPALDRPCTERAVDHALACGEQRIAAHRPERSVLVHGDVHQWNALQWGQEFKLVDPDGLVVEPEYDLGVLMREDPVELLEGDPWTRARLVAYWTGLDPTAVWQWGVVERVSTGLLATDIGLQPVGRQMLAAADRIADSYHRPVGR
ncbi:MAG: aminoglycoside phosphotransferase family protein [Acidimicrobiales bacterium]